MFGYSQGQPPAYWPAWSPPSASGHIDRSRTSLQGRALQFATYADGQLRTCGVVIARTDHSALDLGGLDVDRLSAMAIGPRAATAQGKLLSIGIDGAAVFQTRPGRHPELACCGNAAAVAPLLIHRRRISILTQCGIIDAAQRRIGDQVHQRWALPDFNLREDHWHGRTIIRCDALNDYVVLTGPLPAGMDPQIVRQMLSGDRLTSKLVILEPRSSGLHARFVNDGGDHGAAPATGLATLALLARTCASMKDLLRGGRVAFDSPDGCRSVPLPPVTHDIHGQFSVRLPSVAVRLAPLPERSSQ